MGYLLRFAISAGHPAFHQEGWIISHELTLKFGRCYFNGLDLSLVKYTLRLSADRCSVEKMLTSGYDGYYRDGCRVTGQLQPEDAVMLSRHEPLIMEMAQRVNKAIAQGETLEDLSAYIDSWSERDKDFAFTLRDGMPQPEISQDDQKKPIPNEYGIDFYERMGNKLRLIFRDGHAIFEGEGLSSGRVLTLKYGLCSYPQDLQTCLVWYSLELSPDGCSVVKMESSGYHGYQLGSCWMSGQLYPADRLSSKIDPVILEMTRRVNRAVAEGESLDLSIFAVFCSERDRYFAFMVGDDSTDLERSPRYYKKHVPNDDGLDFREAWLEQMGKTVSLTLRKGRPVFELEGVGSCFELSLEFGLSNIDDIFIPAVSYTLRLTPDGCSIQKSVDHKYKYDLEAEQHDPLILEMEQLINLAISKGDTLDLSYYLDMCSEKDRYFSFRLVK